MKQKGLGSCGAGCYQVAVVNDAERPFRVVTCDPRTKGEPWDMVGVEGGVQSCGGWGGQRGDWSQIIEAWQP